MMKEKMFFVISLFIALSLFLTYLPSADGVIFRIGSKLPEGEIDLFMYSSGAVIACEQDFKNNVSVIFDGNDSTGLDDYLGTGQNMNIYISFPFTLNVSTITVKNSFGGGAGKYNLNVAYKDNWAGIAGASLEERTYVINSSIDTLQMTITRKSLA